MLEKFHVILALIAALAVTILSFIQDVALDVLTMRLIVVIPVFFILGFITKSYLKKILDGEHEASDINLEEQTMEAKKQTEEDIEDNQTDEEEEEDDFFDDDMDLEPDFISQPSSESKN